MGRKRQRSRADDDPTVTVDESEDPTSQEAEESNEERKKELDVWDAFREEHHEVLEQLPLSLHRQYKLMRELDAQNDVFHAGLLASVRRYIDVREHIASLDDHQRAGAATGVDNATGVDTLPTTLHDDSAGPLQDPSTVNGGLQGRDPSSPPVVFQPKRGETTRTLLQQIAQTSEEAIRTAEEKVNIAQTVYETVDRQIRLLDQAIKEQEAAISLGVRPGTHLAPILLPDLVVPRWARPPRVEHSPVPSLSPEPEPVVEEPPISLPPAPKTSKKGKKVAAPKPPKLDEEVQPTPVVGGEEPPVAPRTRRAAVRLTLPAQPPSQPPGPSVPVDPNEPRYCYCHQVSFGTMIGCDNEGCKMEWFHLECTGLLEVPSKKTKWYCRECKPKMTHKGRSKM